MSGPQSYPCSTCKRVFYTRSRVKSHYRASVTCTATRCSTCHKVFVNPDGLAAHCKAKRHGAIVASCKVCKKGFKKLIGLEAHMNALGHFTVAQGPVVSASITTNDMGLGSIEPTPNPSTYLDGQGEISVSDSTDNEGQKVPTSDRAPSAPTSLPSSNHSEGDPNVTPGSTHWSPLYPSENLNCAFCDRVFGSPSAVAQHIESGCHPVNRHQVTAAIYAMNIVPDITIKRIEGPPSLPTTIETYVATAASFNGIGYQCYLCRESPFRSLRALNSHLNSAAHDDCKFECPNSKCKGKFKLISAFLQHLESGRCGLADIPEITGYFHGLRAQFSGLLTM